MKLRFRPATSTDLTALVAMLADDPLGATREQAIDPLPLAYATAFGHINNDPNNELIVAEQGDEIVAMLQLTYIPYLTHQGAWRCLIEGVRVHSNYRGRGVGKLLFEWAIDRARNQGCRLLQLTSDKQRPDAIRFYQQLGFVASHEGLKLKL